MVIQLISRLRKLLFVIPLFCTPLVAHADQPRITNLTAVYFGDGRVEGSFTAESGTGYINSARIHYDTNSNINSDDFFDVIPYNSDSGGGFKMFQFDLPSEFIGKRLYYKLEVYDKGKVNQTVPAPKGDVLLSLPPGLTIDDSGRDGEALYVTFTLTEPEGQSMGVNAYVSEDNTSVFVDSTRQELTNVTDGTYTISWSFDDLEGILKSGGRNRIRVDAFDENDLETSLRTSWISIPVEDSEPDPDPEPVPDPGNNRPDYISSNTTVTGSNVRFASTWRDQNGNDLVVEAKYRDVSASEYRGVDLSPANSNPNTTRDTTFSRTVRGLETGCYEAYFNAQDMDGGNVLSQVTGKGFHRFTIIESTPIADEGLIFLAYPSIYADGLMFSFKSSEAITSRIAFSLLDRSGIPVDISDIDVSVNYSDIHATYDLETNTWGFEPPAPYGQSFFSFETSLPSLDEGTYHLQPQYTDGCGKTYYGQSAPITLPYGSNESPILTDASIASDDIESGGSQTITATWEDEDNDSIVDVIVELYNFDSDEYTTHAMSRTSTSQTGQVVYEANLSLEDGLYSPQFIASDMRNGVNLSISRLAPLDSLVFDVGATVSRSTIALTGDLEQNGNQLTVEAHTTGGWRNNSHDTYLRINEAATGAPVDDKVSIIEPGDAELLSSFTGGSSWWFPVEGTEATTRWIVDISGLEPGEYNLELSVSDGLFPASLPQITFTVHSDNNLPNITLIDGIDACLSQEGDCLPIDHYDAIKVSVTDSDSTQITLLVDCDNDGVYDYTASGKSDTLPFQQDIASRCTLDDSYLDGAVSKVFHWRFAVNDSNGNTVSSEPMPYYLYNNDRFIAYRDARDASRAAIDATNTEIDGLNAQVSQSEKDILEQQQHINEYAASLSSELEIATVVDLTDLSTQCPWIKRVAEGECITESEWKQYFSSNLNGLKFASDEKDYNYTAYIQYLVSDWDQKTFYPAIYWIEYHTTQFITGEPHVTSYSVAENAGQLKVGMGLKLEYVKSVIDGDRSFSLDATVDAITFQFNELERIYISEGELIDRFYKDLEEASESMADLYELNYREKAELLSLSLDITPLIGSSKALAQLYEGRDVITGQPVNRWFELFGVIPQTKAVPIIKKVSTTAKGMKAAVEINYKVGKKAEEVLSSSQKLINALGSGIKLGGSYRPKRDDLGLRLYDMVTKNGRTAIESKVGRLSRSEFLRKQIKKDLDALRTNDKGQVYWFSTPNKRDKKGYTDGFAKMVGEEFENIKKGYGFTVNPATILFCESELDFSDVDIPSLNRLKSLNYGQCKKLKKGKNGYVLVPA